jgi:leucyl/phenylalanyl-tRNA---protein transferase
MIFPDPRLFDAHGLVAAGADLSAERLVAAYRSGLFPWYDEPPILWWSPDPRAVLDNESLHLSRSMKRTLRKTPWTVTQGTALSEVMQGCAGRREGTWLQPEMQAAYLNLGRRGEALSYEVWEEGALVGGLYGVLLGGFFAAESKFHRRTDASKVALVCAVMDLWGRGLRLFDVQFLTKHLGTMGVHEVSRAEYLSRLADALSVTLRPAEAGQDLLPSVREALSLG